MARLGDKWVIQTPATGGGWSPWEEIYTKYYGTECESVTPLQSAPKPDYRKTLGGSFAYYGSKPTGKITVVFLVGGSTWTVHDMDIAVAQMRSDFRHIRLKQDGTDYEYECVLTNWAVEDTGVSTYYYITCAFDAIASTGIVTVDIPAGESRVITNESPETVGMTLTLTFNKGFDIYALEGDVAWLHGVQVGDIWKFDGMGNGQVTCNGVPALSRAQSYLVPRLVPGENTITCTPDYSATVEFRNIWR